jgi:hypothetical protein
VIFFFSGLPLALTSIYTREFGGGLKEFAKVNATFFLLFCAVSWMRENEVGPYLTQRLT